MAAPWGQTSASLSPACAACFACSSLGHLFCTHMLHATSGDSRSWMVAVADDITWLKDLQVIAPPETQSLGGVQAWTSYTAAPKSRRRSMLRDAVLEAKRRREHDFHMTPACSQENMHETHICAECGAKIGTAASLRSHFAKAHLSNSARKYADGDTCRACLERFSTWNHVIFHFAFSRRGASTFFL